MNSIHFLRQILLICIAGAMPFADARSQAANSGPAPFSFRAAQQLDLSFDASRELVPSGPAPGSFRASQQLAIDVASDLGATDPRRRVYLDRVDTSGTAFANDRERDLEPDSEHSTIRFRPFGRKR